MDIYRLPNCCGIIHIWAKKLGHPRTAPRGNQLGALGMLVAVVTTVLDMQLAEGDAEWTLIAAVWFGDWFIDWLLDGGKS